jgi:hypothetical protein
MIYTTYHSTPECNIESIIKNGFQERFGSCYGLTFGSGVYTTTDIKYASSYNIECDKILECEISSEKTISLKTREYKKNINRIKQEEPDLVVINDATEYVCKNLKKIRVVSVITVKKIIMNEVLQGVEIIKKVNI